jgi:trans-aconitate methyltransferase
VITAGLVLFFLPDARAALSAYRELLRPGGRLAFSTFATPDPNYRAAMRALAAYAEDPPPAAAETFQDPDWLREAVVSAGFSGTVIAPFTVHTAFRDRDHLVEWIGSHNGRNVLRRIPPDRWPAARAALTPLFPEAPKLTTTIHLVTAHTRV